jgi:hypothetical protein
MPTPADHRKITTAKTNRAAHLLQALLAALTITLIAGSATAQGEALNDYQAELLRLEAEAEVFWDFRRDVLWLRRADRRGELATADVEAALQRAKELIPTAERFAIEAEGLLDGDLRSSGEPYSTEALYEAAASSTAAMFSFWADDLGMLVIGGRQALVNFAPLDSTLDAADDAEMFRLLANQSYRLDQLDEE